MAGNASSSDSASPKQSDTSAKSGEVFEPQSTSRSLREVASHFFQQRPGSRAGTEKPRSPGTKEIVNGLDEREFVLAVCATVLEIVLTLLGYYVGLRHSTNVDVRRAAPSLLLAGIVAGAILAIGTAFRRRALVGFACFIVGFEMISFSPQLGSLLLPGCLYIFFGGWLVMRVMRKQKQDRALRALTQSSASRPDRRLTGGPPKPSKRYTPPRRARTLATKKR